MASPVAHSLAGSIIYFAMNRDGVYRRWEFWLVILAANFADLDLLPGLLLGDESLFHRSVSHSLLFTLALCTVLYAIFRVIAYPRARQLTTMMGLALLSQLLIDWLSYDDAVPQGMALLWPFSDTYYMSDVSLFLNARRDSLFTLPVIEHNLRALALEVLILGFPAWLLARRAIRRSDDVSTGSA